jgi:hypothetical protein
MMSRPVAAILLLLVACSGGESETGKAGPAADNAAPPTATPSASQAAPSKAYLVEEKLEFLEFTYGWPAEAAAIPKLASLLEADMAAQRKEALSGAREDREARGADAPYPGHYLSKVWQTSGQTKRLLSLVAEVGSFTGGAHGNAAYEAWLWDRQADARIETGALFTDPAAASRAITASYCKELDRQRAEKRQEGDAPEAGDWTTQCPPLAEQVLVPTDGNKDGRFELLRVIIGPYGAGPYSEGSYEIDLPVTDPLRKLIKPEYAGAF